MSMPLRPGDLSRLGPYELVGRLGEGGMGTVFLGRDPDGRPVAIKTVRPEYAADAEFRGRFRSEVNRAQQVPPFSTAEVLDADPDHEPPYLVVEYVDGPSLAAEIREKGSLTGATLHSVAVGVATALTAIHGAGVIHRDLKPGNVLFARGGIKVIDFGIARAFEATSQHTRTDQMVGTVAYMAPERFDPIDGRPVTAAADIFAWGAVVVYAATGRTPFAAESAAATAMRILTQPPDLNGVPDSLAGIVEQALAKDPAERPTARDLLDLLLASAPATSSRPAASPSPSRPASIPSPARPAPSSATGPAASPTPASHEPARPASSASPPGPIPAPPADSASTPPSVPWSPSSSTPPSGPSPSPAGAPNALPPALGFPVPAQRSQAPGLSSPAQRPSSQTPNLSSPGPSSPGLPSPGPSSPASGLSASGPDSSSFGADRSGDGAAFAGVPAPYSGTGVPVPASDGSPPVRRKRRKPALLALGVAVVLAGGGIGAAVRYLPEEQLAGGTSDPSPTVDSTSGGSRVTEEPVTPEERLAAILRGNRQTLIHVAEIDRDLELELHSSEVETGDGTGTKSLFQLDPLGVDYMIRSLDDPAFERCVGVKVVPDVGSHLSPAECTPTEATVFSLRRSGGADDRKRPTYWLYNEAYGYVQWSTDRKELFVQEVGDADPLSTFSFVDRGPLPSPSPS
ncbi:serine/threonine protein kinase [Actinoplanes sp. DH11]|uniref:serine/threonine protein kinase n=1 Tax=Actinoplanes sp. DH11 TaxID=2857011 RepID=UPI002714DC42|nr:serine/threonine protein kinase [Actinoplanes sp. DH11]